MWTPLWASLLASLAAGSINHRRPIVATREGLVKGFLSRSAGGHDFHSFKGVPYARPPVGFLRFRPPRRHPVWRGVLTASNHGSVCSQFESRRNATILGSENCLFANIYTRRLPKTKKLSAKLPVMVYVHGGGFQFGEGDSTVLGPDYLMDKEIVLVTFNYRLGLFGFLSTLDASAPGNYGVLDQVLVLQWVQDNIAAFGGDPRQVTIFGNSAGGNSVSLLLLSPLAKGLFHHAITQSGSSLSNTAVMGRQRGIAKAYADYLHCDLFNSAAIIRCLRKASTDDLMEATMALNAFTNVFTPRIDKESENPFLPQDPRTLLEDGNFNLVPRMHGLTEDEGFFFIALILQNKRLAEALLAGVPAVWTQFTDLALQSEPPVLDCDVDPTQELAKILKFLAPNNAYSYGSINGFTTGRTFVAPISQEIRLASAHAPVYKYLLDYRGPGRQRVTQLENLPVPYDATTHTEDILYLFSREDRPLKGPRTPGYKMIRFMVDLWTSFARTGYPSSEVLSMPDWPIFTEQSQRHMRLNLAPSLGDRLFGDQVAFWQTVAYNEPWRHPVVTSCEVTKAAQTAATAREPAE